MGKHRVPLIKMEEMNPEKEIKIAGEKLNQDTIKQMEKCVQELTTSGSPSLDTVVMKKFKRFCRESDDYVRYAFWLIMRQLKRKHSEIRLSAFQMADELFNRSHAFREILVTHLQPFLALTTATESERPLPPPKSAADKLKRDTLHAFQQWYDKYSLGYRKLAVGYNYLKNCKYVDFNNIRAENEAERRRSEAAEKKKQKIMADRLAKVLKDISETKSEIENCAKEAESCLQLLLPTPTDFLLSLSEDVAPPASTRVENGSRATYDGSSKSNEVCHSREKTEENSSKLLKSDEKVSEATFGQHEQNATCSTGKDSDGQEVDQPSAVTSSSLSCNGPDTDNISHLSKDDKGKASCTDEGGYDFKQSCVNSKSQENSSQNFSGQSKVEESIESNAPSEKLFDAAKTIALEDGNDSMHEDEDDDTDEYGSDEDMVEDLQAHGLTNPTHSLTLEIPAPGPVSVQVTSDNKDVARSLKDASKLIRNSYLPKVTKWLEILGKNGAKQSDITAAIDLKVHLESIKEKCVDLKLVSEEEEEVEKMEQEDSDDEEFEEVPEKEGFEPRIPSHLRAEYGLAGPSGVGKQEPKPQPLKRQSSSTSSVTSVSSVSLKTQGKSSSGSTQWNLKERIKSEDTADPASLAAALARIKSEKLEEGVDTASASTSSSSSLLASSSTTPAIKDEQPSSAVPVIEFGTDLAFWENPDKMEAPTIVKYDSLHRFWTPKEAESEKPSQHDLAAVRNRVFTYTGKFEPVKWKCRAPMPNGKLCERMDRVKCPFHGKIIARDEQGNPAGEEKPSASGDVKVKIEETSEAVSENGELPPWQDPELQREIELATGHDLGSARSQKLLDKAAKSKGKGKGKGKKHSNLTDINAIKNTTRKRLEDKVFKKSSLKRVCATLDRADYKRVRDKFGNQFNYSLK